MNGMHVSAADGYMLAPMKLFYDLFLILFAGFWLFMAARKATRDLNRCGRKSTWLASVPALVGLIGFAGFFAQMLSGEGIIKLPRTYEWPAGYATHVVRTPDGKYLVPLVPAGRLQLYSADWHFLRGWNINALGGDFRAAENSDGTIEVFAARGRHNYTFNENGDLVSSRDLPDAYGSLPNSGESLIVRTPLVLWPYSSPFISVVVGTVGFLGHRWVKKRLGGAKAPTERERSSN